jgi:hypothetical protein
MFVVFYVDAYFTLGGEVLLYFSVGVEVIEIVNLIRIQIGLKFGKDLKNKSLSHFFYWPWAETPSPAQPGSASLPMCTARVAAQRNSTTRGPAGHQPAQRSLAGSVSPTRGRQPDRVHPELVSRWEYSPSD